MKHFFKRIFQILFGIILLILISSAAITFFFSETVEKREQQIRDLAEIYNALEDNILPEKSELDKQ